MREGFYRIQYETKTFRGFGVVTVHGAIFSGCDRYYFMYGTIAKKANRLNCRVTYSRHTRRPNLDPWVPEKFVLIFEGVGGDNFGQCEFACPDIPQIRGVATLTWLGSYMA